MSGAPYILYLPEVALEKIFSFLSYDEIAKNRIATLSVDNAQKVMVFGQSKDLGFCKSTRKSGDKCTAFVNTHNCEYCIYHIKQEYQKCSRRSELQANFAGRGLTALRNKVLGKNEVFYAGKSYMAIKPGKNKKLAEKDKKRMGLLSGNAGPQLSKTPKSLKQRKIASQLEMSYNQKCKDLELLKKLGGLRKDESAETEFNGTMSSSVSLNESKNTALSIIAKLKSSKESIDNEQKPSEDALPSNQQTIGNATKENDDSLLNKATLSSLALNLANNAPVLKDFGKSTVDLSTPISKKHISRAKLNALKFVKKNGPIEKIDPNRVRPKKRPSTVLDKIENDPKKQKILDNEFYSERFKKMMAATSRHADLLEVRDEEEQEKYFKKLEMKEKLEEKMLSTYKVPCKAVRCLKCKYTNFSAADRCKTEKHPLKVYDAVKRFFKCGDCGNRTCCLEVVPTVACKNCGSGRWERAGMMKERKPDLGHSLSIRGGEQKFVNSVVADANINLLVPEDC